MNFRGPREIVPSVRLRENRVVADSDGNGRIDKDEYRVYFQGRLANNVEMVRKTADQSGKSGSSTPGGNAAAAAGGLPAWFTTLDTDKDGQVGLYEWRKAGKATATFNEMDLDQDGLLTRDEYLRFLKLSEKKGGEPPPLGKQQTKD
jgi:Ca2+-binding EF-hand superfamily protein